MTRAAFTLILLALVAPDASAGHSRFSYFDGGQSADGRFTVTIRRVDGPAKPKGQPDYHWEYTWTDTRSGKSHAGKLDGYRRGTGPIQEQVHAHVFVAPDGETFAVWNPQALAPTPGDIRLPADLSAREARDYAGFARRLVVYKKTGEVVKELGVKDFLTDGDWAWLYGYGCGVYWVTEYPGLTTRSAPRPMYAVYRVSPDYTVLEFAVGATQEAAHKAKAKGVTPPAPRVVRVSLTDGRLLAPDEQRTDSLKVPVRPFKGGLADKGGTQHTYVPSLDPLRAEGKFGAAGLK